MAITDKAETPRGTIVIFFIVDTSGSMEGERIGALNTFIRALLPDLRDTAEANNAKIKIAVLAYSSGARWITAEGPVDADRFKWKDLEAGGITDMGEAFKMLNEKLSGNDFMPEIDRSYAPIMFLFCDGEPTDEWIKELALLKQNKWFKAAIKAALPVGEDANKDVLKAFTGSSEAVLEVCNQSVLLNIIKFADLPVTFSEDDPAAEAKQNEFIQAMNELKEESAAGNGDEW